jgi:formylglycine-generating enzyme required for sulfatase activity
MAAELCPKDSVVSGTACIDKYEASVWETRDKALVQKIKKGTVTRAELLAGAIQRGVDADDYPCAHTGAGCLNIYAVSVRGIRPSSYINWFQAAAAARNSGKRLATNAEWQVAALGTPDPGTDDGVSDCNITGSVPTPHDPEPSGARSSCKSDVGAFDMVGNLDEWVADWVPFSSACGTWFGFADDRQCLLGASTTAGTPGALTRGGYFAYGTSAGVFAVSANTEPFAAGYNIGFRAVRPVRDSDERPFHD